MTDIRFREDVNTGYGLYCDLSFEQVKFVSLKKVAITKTVTSSLSKKAETKTSTGKADSTINSTSTTTTSTSTSTSTSAAMQIGNKVLTTIQKAAGGS